MINLKKISFVLVFLGVASAQTSNLGFDYFLLVRQWGPTFCSTSSCKSTPVAEFTIHGLWPQYYSGGYPENCDPTNKFSTNNLPQPLLNQLSCEWVSYTGTNAAFWSYEWGKHGTCALDRFPTQADYFNATIALNNKYESTQALLAAGIDPATASSQSIYKLQDAFESAWGVAPVITCSGSGLNELRLCVDAKSLQAIDCPSNLKYSKCGGGAASFPKGADVPAVCAQYYPEGGSNTGGSGGSGGSSGGSTTSAAAVMAGSKMAVLVLACVAAVIATFI